MYVCKLIRPIHRLITTKSKSICNLLPLLTIHVYFIFPQRSCILLTDNIVHCMKYNLDLDLWCPSYQTCLGHRDIHT